MPRYRVTLYFTTNITKEVTADNDDDAYEMVSDDTRITSGIMDNLEEVNDEVEELYTNEDQDEEQRYEEKSWTTQEEWST